MKRHPLVAAVLITAVAGCSSASDDPPRAWTEAFDATSFGWILNVWGPSSSQLYAVGGTPDEGRVQRFDGERWSREAIGLDVPLLNWAYGFGEDDIYVVGNEGTILHYDGQWSQTATVTDQDLWGVWGARPDDVWAVGGNGRAEGQATLLRFDGTTWRRIALPPLEQPVFALFKVWGTSADNVYFVGQRGALLRWDGASIEQILVGTSRDLIALWGTGPDRIVVVGGRGNGVVVTWDGVEWAATDLGAQPGLNGVWMRRADVAHLAGVAGRIFRFDFDARTVIDESPTEVFTDFHAIFGDIDGGRLLAVGGNFNFVDGPFEGVAYLRSLQNDD